MGQKPAPMTIQTAAQANLYVRDERSTCYLLAPAQSDTSIMGTSTVTSILLPYLNVSKQDRFLGTVRPHYLS